MKRESCGHQGVAKMGGRCGHDRREKDGHDGRDIKLTHSHFLHPLYSKHTACSCTPSAQPPSPPALEHSSPAVQMWQEE